MSSIISYSDLQEMFGGNNYAELAVKLQEQKIKYFLGKRGRPYTTIDAINSAIGVGSKRKQLNDNPQPRQIHVG